MRYITQIDRELPFAVALQAFAGHCQQNAARLNLSSQDLLEIEAMAIDLLATQNQYFAAKLAAASALEVKDEQLRTSKARLSKWAQTFRANPAIDDALLALLELPPHKTPGTHSPPATPTHLQAIPDVQGNVTLRWNRNGNRDGTQFFVETRTDPGGEWVMVGGTTKTKFRHRASLGAFIAFRVTAARAGRSSSPTIPVVLWANGQSLGAVDLAA